jgi:hypothetical protein
MNTLVQLAEALLKLAGLSSQDRQPVGPLNSLRFKVTNLCPNRIGQTINNSKRFWDQADCCLRAS